MMMGEWKIREMICDIGRRLYNKGFAAANDGNITHRLSANTVMCTPTGVSKGFMKPGDLCVCDLSGKQLGGNRPITSEIKLHLEVYKALPKVNGVVHCHAPHAVAFGIAGIDIPTCVVPEVEIAIGMIPTAKYETPGSQAFAETIKPFLEKANTVVLANHGTVSWGETLELAWFRTEILDAYCRILMLANNLGNVNRLPAEKVRELLDLRPAYGFPADPRAKLENCDLCANSEFGRGIAAGASGSCTAQLPERQTVDAATYERLVQTITDQVMAAAGG